MLKYGTTKEAFIESLRRAVQPVAQATGTGPCLLYTHVATPLLQKLVPADWTVVWGFGGLSVPLVRIWPPSIGTREIGAQSTCSLANGNFHAWVMLQNGGRIDIADFALDMFRDRRALTWAEWPVVPRTLWAKTEHAVGQNIVGLRIPRWGMRYMHYAQMRPQVVAWISAHSALLTQMADQVAMELAGVPLALL